MTCNTWGTVGDGAVAAGSTPGGGGPGGQQSRMARTGDPALGSTAAPAALRGRALRARAVHLHQGRPTAGIAQAVLAASRGGASALLGGWLPPPAEAAAALAAGALLCLSAVIKLRGRGLLGSGARGGARGAGGRDLRALRRRGPLRRPKAGRSDATTEPRVRLGDHHRRALWLPADEHLLAPGPTGSGQSAAPA